MDVAELLQLQRPFHRRREAERPADVDDVTHPRQRLRQLPDRGSAAQRLRGLRRQPSQAHAIGPDPVLAHRRAEAREVDGDHRENDELGHERLRRGDGHLGTRLQVADRIRLARDRAADDVRDGHDLRP